MRVLLGLGLNTLVIGYLLAMVTLYKGESSKRSYVVALLTGIAMALIISGMAKS